MTRMPGAARCARALLLLLGVSGLVGAGRLAVAAAGFESGALGGPVLAGLLLAAAACGATAVTALAVAARFAEGGGRVRRAAVAVGWVFAVAGTAAGLAHHGAWGAGSAAGALLVGLAGGEPARQWFDRGRLSPPCPAGG
ncbi:hypothetical protein ABZ782_02405 [Streptomyces asoensis]|uniref:hypothetical protein n=1 Tax=Streptomyces asoensis TaxID=249586 RepID=UPI0033EEF94F